MTSTRVLKMVFVLENSKTMTWSMSYPKTGLTRATVTSFMNEIIEDEFIRYNNNEATEIKDAYIYETNKIELQ